MSEQYDGTPTLHAATTSASTPLVALMPSMITLAGLCFGLFSLKFAYNARWEHAVICIVFAAFIDGIDGALARKLNAASQFGAELDSLADFFNFAVAPAFISYMWMTNEIKGAGWAVCVFYVMCGAIRLARFNAAAFDKLSQQKSTEEIEEILTDSNSQTSPFRVFRSRFCGIPAPAGGLLCLMPMMIVFFQQETFDVPYLNLHPSFYMVYIAIIGALMMSRVPTLSFKGMKISSRYVPLVMVGFAALIVSLVTNPWLTLPIIGIGYMILIPITLIHSRYSTGDR